MPAPCGVNERPPAPRPGRRPFDALDPVAVSEVTRDLMLVAGS
ncbi:hypothetical protein J2S43_002315 [Catenuloplanes nepalensis]|uniref:Uncharacterized protein n=1 Tax=Catenuloplanes nepalensis TaxID=587533 RepID=A0ABT9MR98_9ACTN|nr:hypothetical protein [Catenuloplanes nepalensis]